MHSLLKLPQHYQTNRTMGAKAAAGSCHSPATEELNSSTELPAALSSGWNSCDSEKALSRLVVKMVL